jgi:hypothetical protein
MPIYVLHAQSLFLSEYNMFMVGAIMMDSRDIAVQGNFKQPRRKLRGFQLV